MAYEVYYNKQQSTGLAESPPTDLGFAQQPQVNQGLTVSQGIGLGVVASRVIPAGKQVFNTVIDATGNSRLKRNVNRINSAIGFGVTALTLGLPAAVGVASVTYVVERVADQIQNNIDNINQNYEIQKQGSAVNKFVGVGVRYD